MNSKQLQEKLFVFDQLERKAFEKDNLLEIDKMFHFKTKTFYEQEVICFDMVSQDMIEISKHPRYTFVPEHIHTYMELCYVYSGKCVHEVDNKRIELKENQILLMDQNVKHRIHTLKSSDIVINIMISNKFLSSNIVKKMNNGSLVVDFLLRAKSNESRRENYILFSMENDNEVIKSIMNMILCEFYDAKFNSNFIVNSAIGLLFQYISRESTVITNMSLSNKHRHSILSIDQLLDFIADNYQKCNLDMLEKRFGFNPHYISTYLKKQTGKSFKEILLKEKLEHAKILLDETTLSIIDIVEIVGFANPTFFYRKFEKMYGIPLSKYERKIVEKR